MESSILVVSDDKTHREPKTSFSGTETTRRCRTGVNSKPPEGHGGSQKEFFSNRSNLQYLKNYINTFICSFIKCSYVHEDLLEEAYAKSLIFIIERKLIERFDPAGSASLKTYLCNSIQNSIRSACRDFLRYTQHYNFVEYTESPGSCKEEQYIFNLDVDRIREDIAASSRSDSHRTKIFDLRLKGYTLKEIAGETGINRKTVDCHIAHIKSIVKKELCDS